VYEATPLRHECRCSEDKVRGVIDGLSEDERQDAADENGQIEMTCEFCSKTYRISI
jgi:molecular chaperone Hsp33